MAGLHLKLCNNKFSFYKKNDSFNLKTVEPLLTINY